MFCIQKKTSYKALFANFISNSDQEQYMKNPESQNIVMTFKKKTPEKVVKTLKRTDPFLGGDFLFMDRSW